MPRPATEMAKETVTEIRKTTALRLERKQATVLFCDLVDYTARSVVLDPEELAEQVRLFHRMCGEVARKYDGHIANYLGDGLLVLFGHPHANEFAPANAVYAGLEMTARARRANFSQRWRGPKPMELRVGIATGLVVFNDHAGDELIFGETPNLAARLQGLAQPNTVLTAWRTRRLVGGAFQAHDLGEHRVKGFAHAVRMWKIIRAREYPYRVFGALKHRTSHLISRQLELQHLRRGYAQAMRGECAIIHISGEPGIGKSRLIRAFEKSILAPKLLHLQRLRVLCSPHFRARPFQPIINETLRWLKIGAREDFDAQQRVLSEAMRGMRLEGGDEHALLGELLGMPMPHGWADLEVGAAAKHRLVAQAVATVVLRLARLRPLLLVVEDLHWADADTLSVLRALIARAQVGKLLVICTSRNDFAAPWTATQAYAPRHIRLGGLNADDAARLIDAVAREFATRVPPPIKRVLIRKSGGVPRFLEETSRQMLGQMRTHSGESSENDAAGKFGAHRIGESAENFYAPLSIPDTLQDALNARLDQLGAGKAFAQLAAVFGTEFRYSLCAKLAAQNNIDARAGVRALLDAELILPYTPNGRNGHSDHYQFRHAIFQEAAYASLLKKTRRQYHHQIAELVGRDDPRLARRHLRAAHRL